MMVGKHQNHPLTLLLTEEAEKSLKTAGASALNLRHHRVLSFYNPLWGTSKNTSSLSNFHYGC